MKNKIAVYDLLVNKQSAIIDLLKIMDVENPEEKIKSILDKQLFEIVECTEYEIIKIKKKSTGEIFEKGSRFYNKEYEHWETNIHFDAALFGVYYGDIYYKNFVRSGRGGLYYLDEISLTDEKEHVAPKEIVLSGITYVAKEYYE